MDVNEIDAGHLLELLADEMAARTDTLCGVGQPIDPAANISAIGAKSFSGS
jgi:hypothetical protein